MSWQDKSGNNGPIKGPWGNPPKGNGSGKRPRSDEPADIEDFLAASRDRFKRAMPKGGGGGGRGGDFQFTPFVGGVVAAVLLALIALSGIYQISPGERGVRTTFGKFSGISGTGWHWRMPVAQDVEVVSVSQLRTEEVLGRSGAENLMLTRDRSIVNVGFSVFWKISEKPAEEGEFPNVAKFVFNIEGQENLVEAVSEAAMREAIGARELEPIITSGQRELEDNTKSRIQEVLDQYDSGIEVLRVNLKKPEVPIAVRDAFADVIIAGNQKEAMINEAQRSANQIVPVAQGQAAKSIEEARAYAASVTADSLGQAERFNRIYEEYIQAPEVTRRRMYLETMERVLGRVDKVILDENEGGNGVVPYLPLNELGKKSNQ